MSHDSENEDKIKNNPGELYLVSEESISFVLRTGLNVIHTPGTRKLLPPPAESTSTPNTNSNPNFNHQSSNGDDNAIYYLEENVGILPISGPAVISTTGFEWDVSDWKTSMGGQISTSNHIRADVVTVQTNEQILFTAELAERFKAL